MVKLFFTPLNSTSNKPIKFSSKLDILPFASLAKSFFTKLVLKDIRYFSPDELSGIECAPDYIKQEFRKKPGNTIVTRWAD